MILLIDNYDSFSYNLYQLVGSLSPDIRVVRNDQVSVEDIRRMNPSHLILSPGPGRPAGGRGCVAGPRGGAQLPGQGGVHPPPEPQPPDTHPRAGPPGGRRGV